jgi:hypothetical protein
MADTRPTATDLPVAPTVPAAPRTRLYVAARRFGMHDHSGTAEIGDVVSLPVAEAKRLNKLNAISPYIDED